MEKIKADGIIYKAPPQISKHLRCVLMTYLVLASVLFIWSAVSNSNLFVLYFVIAPCLSLVGLYRNLLWGRYLTLIFWPTYAILLSFSLYGDPMSDDRVSTISHLFAFKAPVWMDLTLVIAANSLLMLPLVALQYRRHFKNNLW